LNEASEGALFALARATNEGREAHTTLPMAPHLRGSFFIEQLFLIITSKCKLSGGFVNAVETEACSLGT